MEDRLLLREEVERSVEFRDSPSVQDEDSVVEDCEEREGRES